MMCGQLNRPLHSVSICPKKLERHWPHHFGVGSWSATSLHYSRTSHRRCATSYLKGGHTALCAPSPSLTLLQPPTFRLTPLLCKEGRGEVECRRLYPTQPPLTKGRRKRRVRVSSPFVNNPD